MGKAPVLAGAGWAGEIKPGWGVKWMGAVTEIPRPPLVSGDK